MKKLHLIKPKNDKVNPWAEYIQVRGGLVYSFNENEGVIIPADEVFGKKIIKSDEEIYFSKLLWETSNAGFATKFTRDGDKFTVYIKNVITGYLFPAGQIGAESGQLQIGNTVINFPKPVHQTEPDEISLSLGMNADSVARVSEVLGLVNVKIVRENDSPKYPHIVLNSDTGSSIGGVGFSAGIPDLIYEIGDQPEDDGPEEEEFEVEIGGHALAYRTDSIQLQEWMNRIVELTKNVNVEELLDTIEMM